MILTKYQIFFMGLFLGGPVWMTLGYVYCALLTANTRAGNNE